MEINIYLGDTHFYGNSGMVHSVSDRKVPCAHATPHLNWEMKTCVKRSKKYGSVKLSAERRLKISRHFSSVDSAKKKKIKQQCKNALNINLTLISISTYRE